MNNFRNLILSLILLFCGFSCSEKKGNTDGLIENIIIEEGNPVDILFSQIFDTCYFVPLDTEAIIGELTQLNFGKKYISVLDSRVSENLYLFDWNGNLKHTISEKGEGPGQYIFPQYFSTQEEEGKIYVYSNGSKKVLVFNLEGDFISEFNTSNYESFLGLKHIKNSFLTGISVKEGGQDNFIRFLDFEFSKQDLIEIPDELVNVSGNMGKVNYFYEEMLDNGFFYQPVFSPDFVKFNQTGVDKIYRFSFSNRGFNYSDPNILKSDYLSISQRDGLVFIGDNHVDGGDVLFLDLTDSGRSALGLFDKRSQKAVIINKLVNDMSLMINFNAIPGSYNNQPGYLSIALPYSIFNQIRSQLDLSGNHYENIIKSVDSEDGESLVLMIYKVKEEVKIEF